jgi:hypothetical protein
MSDSDCAMMELHCLERARSDPLNRGKWIAQAERWHELARGSELLAISGEAPSTVDAFGPNGYANRMRVTRLTASFAILSQALPWNLSLFAVSLNLEYHQPGVHRRRVFAMSKEKPNSPNERQFRG